MKIRVTWTAPTHPRKKFTAASLKLCRVSIGKATAEAAEGTVKKAVEKST
jgi:hypothetical protein